MRINSLRCYLTSNWKLKKSDTHFGFIAHNTDLENTPPEQHWPALWLQHSQFPVILQSSNSQQLVQVGPALSKNAQIEIGVYPKYS